MQKYKLLSPFLISIITGALVWILVYLITPVSPVYSFNNKTALFILLSYASLLIGYYITPSFTINLKKDSNSHSIAWILVLVVLFGFTIRFIDLFVLRNLAFSNSIYENRDLALNTTHQLFFLIGSLPKYLFFAPLIFTFYAKSNNRILIAISSLLFFLPLVEAVLRGSRSPFLISFSLFIIVLLFFNKLKFNKKTFFAFTATLLILFIISSSLLAKREKEKTNKNLYKSLLKEAKYNDFIAPKESIYQWFDQSENELLKKEVVNLLHVGQYYTHAVFEFNYLIQQDIPQKQYGKYTFSLIPKLLNHIGITNYDLNKISESNPRQHTFIGFLGGLYLDFGWYTFIVLFIFGAVQKTTYQSIKERNIFFTPLFIYFLFTNFFILTFNFYAGNGTSILIVCVIFALFNFIYSRYATSTNS